MNGLRGLKNILSFNKRVFSFWRATKHFWGKSYFVLPVVELVFASSDLAHSQQSNSLWMKFQLAGKEASS